MPSSLQVNLRGGENLKRKLAELGQKATGASLVRVGFLEGSTYPDGTSVPLVAFWNEFGTKTAPPRPFFRRMIKAKSHEWGPGLANLLKANGGDAKKSLSIAGEAIVGQLVQSIHDLWDPPLAPSTIARKGFDKPLIDTSRMVKSVRKEVV